MSGRWQTELGKGRAAQSRRDVLRAFAWLLRKLFLSCVFKESFLARLASGYLLADVPSFSNYLHLCLLSSKGKIKKKEKESIQQNLLGFLGHLFFDRM